MQLRQVRQLELRLQGQVVQNSFVTGQSQTMLQGNLYYLVPWTNPWAQKALGQRPDPDLADQLVRSRIFAAPRSRSAVFPVTIVELDAAPTSQSVTAYVDVSAP